MPGLEAARELCRSSGGEADVQTVAAQAPTLRRSRFRENRAFIFELSLPIDLDSVKRADAD